MHINSVASYTGVDIFLLRPVATGQDVNDTSQAERLRVHIYGDSESTEHAKTRILIMIDDIVGFLVLPQLS